MRYTKKERLEISSYEAARAYGINVYTARDYMRLYRDAYNLPSKRGSSKSYVTAVKRINSLPDGAIPAPPAPTGLVQLETMSKEELVRQIIQFRINEMWLGERGWYGHSVREKEAESLSQSASKRTAD